MAKKKKKKKTQEKSVKTIPGINETKYKLVTEYGFKRLDTFLKIMCKEIENDYNVSEKMAISMAYDVFIKYVSSLIAVSASDEEDLQHKLSSLQTLISTEYFKYKHYFKKENE